MKTAQQVIVGSATALVAIAIVVIFSFAFVLAPLLVGGGFVALFLLLQLAKKRLGRG